MTTGKVNLKNIGVVLVEPMYAGNLGACARAMANMGIEELILVRPSNVFTKETAWMATSAYDIIDRAKIYEDLRPALASFHITIGTTRRFGRYRKPDMTPQKMAEVLGPLTQSNRLAVVFGSEDKGLSNADLTLCQHTVTIPTSDRHGSLNLAQAVLLICYEFFLLSDTHDIEETRELASIESSERLFDLIDFTIKRIGLFTNRNPDRMIANLRKIFVRAALDDRDVRTLIRIFKDFNNLINRLALGRLSSDEIDRLVGSGGLKDRNR